VSAFADIASLEPHRVWDGVIGRVVHGDRVTLSVVELDPDCVIPEHSHEKEQVGMIALGSLTFRIGDEVRELEPGGTWRIPANVPHQVRTGPKGAVVLEVFAPPRDDWTALERRQPCPPRWPE
jgi:quercetin dioxygenase-like cupin family protein